MENYNSKIVFKVWLFDSIIFFTVIILVLSLLFYLMPFETFGQPIDKKLLVYTWIKIVIVTLMFSVVVGWRGKKDAVRILKGQSSLLRPLLEGFIVSFVSIILFIFLSRYDRAFIKDAVHVNAYEVLLIFLLISIAVGAAGAVVACALHLLNRPLVKVLSLKKVEE